MSTKVSNLYDTRSLWQLDQDHFLHPYTNFDRFSKDGSTIYVSGKDHFVTDSDGTEYIDGIAGLWCVNVGHGRVELAECMAEQARKLAYYNTFEDASSAPAALLAKRLAEICPANLNHTFFGTGGSQANDTAIKLVHYYFNVLGKPEKKLILSRDLAYHGSTYLAHALTGIRKTHHAFDLPTDLVHYLTAPYAYRRDEGRSEEEFCDFLIDELEQTILRLGSDRVACFIAEPIMGAGGVIVPPKDYQRRTYEVCKQHGILYISDEVVTGFGRLGAMIASESIFDIQPDLIVLAKGLSSGYVPLGATMISDEIYSVISRPKDENPYFSHGFTYSGHALSCAVGLRNIDLIDKLQLCEHVQKVGPYFASQLESLQEVPLVGEVRGSHFMQCVEFVADKQSREPFPDAVAIGKRVAAHCKRQGLIVRPIGPMNILSPPLTFDQEAIDRSVSILRKSIESTTSDLSAEGIAFS